MKTLLFTLMTFVCQLSIAAPNTDLKFFNGHVLASLAWVKQPSISQKNQLKMDLKTSNGQAYDVDASELGAKLSMTEMPDMGSVNETIVAVADPSGNPLAGSFMINGMRLSMSGKWTLELTVPDPDGSGKTETQEFQFSAQ